MKKRFLFFVFLMITNVLYSQKSSSIKINTTEKLVDIPAGDFLPKRMVKEGMLFAKINGGKLFKNVVFTVEPKENGEYKFRYMIQKFSNMLSISNPGLKKISNGYYSGKKEIQSPSSPSDHLLLELQCDLTKNEIQYAWLDLAGNKFDHPVIIGTENGIYKNSAMPNFTMKYLDGTEGSFADFERKALVINWWHTTCAPCIYEMPGLNKLVEKYAKQNVAFLALTPNDSQALEKFFKKHGFLYKHALVDTSEISFWGTTFPRHIIVSESGIVIHDQTGGSKDIYKKLTAFIELAMK